MILKYLPKSEKEVETIMETKRIYNQDFLMEKCALLIRKKR